MNRRKEIDEELKGLGSALAGMPAGHPYTLPEGYFAAFSESVTDALHVDALPGQAATPYTLPEHYFEDFARKIIQHPYVKSAPAARKTKIISLLHPLRIAAAAVVLLFAGLGIYRFQRPAQPASQAMIAQLDDADIHAYIADNIDDFETSQLAEISATPSGLNAAGALSRDEINAYLNDAGSGEITPSRSN